MADHPGKGRRVTTQLDGLDPPPGQLWPKVTNDGLDFWEFGHASPSGLGGHQPDALHVLPVRPQLEVDLQRDVQRKRSRHQVRNNLY